MIAFIALMAAGVLMVITGAATAAVRPADTAGIVRFVGSCLFGGIALMIVGMTIALVIAI
jgi:hypothetical protein